MLSEQFLTNVYNGGNEFLQDNIPFCYYFLYKYFLVGTFHIVTLASTYQHFKSFNALFTPRWPLSLDFVFRDQISDNLPRGRPQATVLEFLQIKFLSQFLSIFVKRWQQEGLRSLSLEQRATLISIPVFLIRVQRHPSNQENECSSQVKRT